LRTCRSNVPLSPAYLFRQIFAAVASCQWMPLDLERLYDAHAQAIFAFVLNLTRSETETRDVLQEVFVKLASRPELLREVRDERGFLLRLAHNLALDLMRRRSSREKRDDRFAAETDLIFEPSHDVDERSFREALSEGLAILPVEQRAVAHLKLWEGLTFEVIADMLGISPNTAASRYRYAIDKLRERLRPLYDEIK
jgi:RNA polymerase sigma-70 factor, ECF subfamily